MSQMSFFEDDAPRFDPDHLAEAEPEEQKKIMKAWFLTHYDDPTNVCPYESREGGFQYIWGGPYDAQEELSNEFSGIVDDDVIDECAQELVNEYSCYEWSGIPDQDQSDDYLAEAIRTSQFYQAFGHSLDTIEQLLDINPPSASEGYFLRLLYASVIIALEAYLSDAFIVTVLADRTLLCKLAVTDPNLKARKVELTDLVRGDVTPEKVVREYLLQISWHNLARCINSTRLCLGWIGLISLGPCMKRSGFVMTSCIEMGRQPTAKKGLCHGGMSRP